MRGALALALLAATSLAGELRSAEKDVVRVAKLVRPCVVTVYSPNKKDADLTGVAISKGNIILTVRSLLLDSSKRLPERFQVRLPERDKIVEAELVDADETSNTVLLRLKRVKARAIRIGRASDVQLGMWVLLLGNAFGAGRESTPTVSLGVVSGLVRNDDKVTGIHTSTLVNPGSFGAPVIDLSGDLIGITAPAVTGDGGQSVIIPYDYVRERYRGKRGAGAKVVGLAPPKRRLRDSIADVFGVVMADAAKRGASALVGVRSGDLVEAPVKEEKPEEPVAKPEPPGGKKKPARRGPPPPPPPVPGKLPAHDRSSGLIVDPAGYVVCPLRITGWPRPFRLLTVDLQDGTELVAQLVGHDERLRVALLKVNAGESLPVLTPSPEGDLRNGMFAIALGFPHGDPARATPQVTVGVVSRIGALAHIHPSFNAVETDAGVAGGNRGGALVDLEGRLIGVLLDVNDTEQSGYLLRTRGQIAGNAGLGFALPGSTLAAILPRLKRGEVLRPVFLGVGTLPSPKGLRVTAVTEKNSKGASTAASAGGIRKGDYIRTIGKQAIRSQRDLQGALARLTVGDSVDIGLERDGKPLTVTVSLGER